jgi:hypothetical protein
MPWKHSIPMHRRQPGEMTTNLTWEDTRTDLIADPRQAFDDVKWAHAWATRAWESAEENSPRKFILMQERQRLAEIGRKLRSRYR